MVAKGPSWLLYNNEQWPCSLHKISSEIPEDVDKDKDEDNTKIDINKEEVDNGIDYDKTRTMSNTLKITMTKVKI